MPKAKCKTCKKKEEIYSKGECRRCYQRGYQRKRFGK